jgi:rhodanese-related sulfurtransferase
MKNYKPVLIGLIIIVAILFWYRNSKLGTQESQKGVNIVDAITFSELVEDKEAFLLDVHIPEQTHIPGTDAFIPYNQISGNLDQLPENKDTLILVYCRSGSMSTEAAEEIAGLGYTQVYDLEGGINAYREVNTDVVITPENQDLGTVIYGEIPETSFILTNFTPAPLKITRVSTSCGCTKAKVEKEELGAYETSQVNVSFDPAVHKDDTDLGEVTRTIYIDTDNPNFPKVTSTITANVIKN